MKKIDRSKLGQAASLEAASEAWRLAAERLEREASKGQQGFTRKRLVATRLRQKESQAKAWLSLFYAGGEYLDVPLDLL